MNRIEVEEALRSLGTKPNRALGQNFCIDEALLMHIAAQVDGLDVLEIGPGLGALTAPLLKRARRVLAVEKDAAMVYYLGERFAGEPRFTVAHGDILRFDIEAELGEPFAVAGNLPYYITTPIAELLLPLLPCTMVLMVQREAAERFFARQGERVYGPVAIMAQLYYDAARLAEVPRTAYYPQPEVDSTVLLLQRKPAPPALPAPVFFAFLNRAFAMRRKTLYNNLSRDVRVLGALEALGLPENARAEALSPEQLLSVFCAL